MTGIKASALAVVFLFISSALIAQSDYVKWKGKVIHDKAGTHLVFDADIADGWHLYSTDLPSDKGPLPTEFRFQESKNYELVGDVREGEAIEKYDENFMVDVKYFEESAQFKQQIQNMSDGSYEIVGTVTFMVCNDDMCMPPVDQEVVFSIE